MAIRESEASTLDRLLLSFSSGAILVVGCVKSEGGRRTWQRETESAGVGQIDLKSKQRLLAPIQTNRGFVKVLSKHESYAFIHTSLFLYLLCCR